MAQTHNLTTKEAAKMVGLHLKTFEKYLRDGKLADFPLPCIQPNGTKRWLSDEVERWIRSRPRAEPLFSSSSSRRSAREIHQ